MNMRGVFWIDPGVSTGLAWALVDTSTGSVAESLKTAEKGSATILKVTKTGYTTEDMVHQASEIWKYWSRFKRQMVREGLLDPDWVILGAENFILTPGHHKPGIEGIFPAYVIGAFDGYRHGLAEKYRPRNRHITPLVLQPASKGMKFNKQPMLRSWGCWVVGKEHERAAFAHLGAYLMDYMSGRRIRR